jgi:hypothetical protein
VDRLRRAFHLFVAGAADGAPLSIKIRSIVQQTQKTIWTGLSRCEESAAASRAKLLLLSRQLRARLQTQRKQQEGPSQPKSAEALYVALWERMLHAIGRAAVNHETDDWPDYFNRLRDLTRKLVAASTTSSLTDDEKETLIRRLLERIDQFEGCWPAADTTRGTGKDQKPVAAEAVSASRRDDDPLTKEATDGARTSKPRTIAAGRVEPSRDADDQLRNWLTQAPAQPAPSSHESAGKNAV